MLESEEFPGSAQCDRNLVEHQQRPMLVAGSANLLPVIQGWNHRDVTHGFPDNRRHISFALQDVLDVIGASQVAGRTAAKRAVGGVGRGRVLAPWQQRSGVLPKSAFTSDG